MPIYINQLTQKYNKYKVLNNINFKFRKGKLYGIIGPNGSGKTTLLKSIARLLKTKEESIWIFGQDILSIKEKILAKKLSMVPQIFNIDSSFTVEDIVAMGRYPYIQKFGQLSEQDKDIIYDSLVKTKLYSHRLRDVNTLSGGELQRVVLARAMAQQTEIMLLDEPLSHLDIHHQIDILNLIKNLCIKENKTILCVMHDLNLAMKYCDELLLINEGKIFASGNTKNVLTIENIREVYGINVEIEEINGNNIIIY